MAPSTGAEAPLPSGLCLGVKCHDAHPILVLTLFASVLVIWLEAAELTVGFQAPWNISHPFSVRRLGAGLQIAMDKINSESADLGNFSWEFTYTNSTCSAKEALAIFTSQVQREQISTLFGPACPEAAEVIGLLASEWNIPIFDFVGQTANLENDFLYDTYGRLVPPTREIGDVLQKTLQYLGWKHIGMFGGPPGTSSWDRVDELWRIVENELKSHFTITAQVQYTSNNPALLQENLRTVSVTARVIILICSSEDANVILLAAEHLGLHAEGFVFIVLQQWQDSFWKEVLTNQKGTHFPTIYESVLLVALSSYRVGPGDEGFRQEVHRRLRGPPFHSSVSAEEQESLAQCLWTPREKGVWITPSMPYRNPERPVRNLSTITWPHGSLSADRHGCGFYNELCESRLSFTGATLVILRMTFLISVLGTATIGLILRMQKGTPQRQNRDIWWQINYDDITILPQNKPAEKGTPVSRGDSSNAASVMISGDFRSFVKNQPGEELFYAPAGLYQGNHVAICFVGDRAEAWIGKPSVLQEIWLVYELRHENIVPFFGVCTEAPSIPIVIQYCKKRSLEDVLRNSDTEMDWIFKLSFAYDIVNSCGISLHRPN